MTAPLRQYGGLRRRVSRERRRPRRYLLLHSATHVPAGAPAPLARDDGPGNRERIEPCRALRNVSWSAPGRWRRPHRCVRGTSAPSARRRRPPGVGAPCARGAPVPRMPLRVHARPVETRFGPCLSVDRAVEALAEMWGVAVAPSGGWCANRLGMVAQAPIRRVYLTSAPIAGCFSTGRKYSGGARRAGNLSPRKALRVP